MASHFHESSEQHRVSRERRGTTWSCDKHFQPIKFYCKDHVIALCYMCATENHVTCNLESIEDILDTCTMKKDDDETTKLLSHLEACLKCCNETAKVCLAFLRSNVQNSFDDKIERQIKLKEEKERLINDEADAKICMINTERASKLKCCCDFADKLVEPMKQRKSELLEELSGIEKKLRTLQSEFKTKCDEVREGSQKIKALMQDDKNLVKNTRHVLEVLHTLHDESRCESVEKIKHTLKSLKFVKGYVNSSFCGTLEYPSGQWQLVETIEVQTTESQVKVLKFVGLVGYDSIALTNHDPNDFGLYVVNLSNGCSKRVIEGKPDEHFVSCSSIDGNRVACGKYRKGCTGDVLTDCITVHDEKWNQIRSIPIPRNVPCDYSYVDVDPDGKILAALFGQSNIHIINPSDGEIEDTITFTGKIVRGRIHGLSSGRVIVRTGDCEVTVISRNGDTTSFLYNEGNNEGNNKGNFCLFRSDTLTDTILVTNWNKRMGRCTVSQMSSEGVIEAKEIAGFDYSTDSYYRSACLVTPSRKLLLCDEKQIFVYQKMCIL